LLKIDEIARIACPDCHGELRFGGERRDGRVHRGGLWCDHCAARWPVRDGLCHLYRDEQVTGPDRLMRSVYNRFSPFHDVSVAMLLPLFQAGRASSTEHAFRDGFMRRLEIGALRPRPDGQPVRILEVGIGTGANLRYLRRDLPDRLPVEIWGVDLSPGMLGVLRRTLRRQSDTEVRLVLGDAHALPFPDHSFDRVFHVGGINGFRDPAVALAEMARVAVPGSPVVVVDEQLDLEQQPNLYHRATFKMVTWYDLDPHCPVESVPLGAVDVRAEQLSLMLFCLSFRMGKALPAPGGAG